MQPAAHLLKTLRQGLVRDLVWGGAGAGSLGHIVKPALVVNQVHRLPEGGDLGGELLPALLEDRFALGDGAIPRLGKFHIAADLLDREAAGLETFDDEESLEVLLLEAADAALAALDAGQQPLPVVIAKGVSGDAGDVGDLPYGVVHKNFGLL